MNNTNPKGVRFVEENKSLQFLYPDLVKEWDWDNNGDVLPSAIYAKSRYQANWKCSLGHTWNAKVANRTNGRKCPYCSNRKVLHGFNDLATIDPEIAKMWHPAKNGNLKPSDVLPNSNKEAVWICENGHEWNRIIKEERKYRNCPYCSKHRIVIGENDLATLYPEIAKEWDYEANGSTLPTDVAPMGKYRASWKCSFGHTWKTFVYNRAGGKNCPYCSGRKVWPGFNDLLHINPEIAAEWHPNKNKDLTAADVTKGSNYYAWWKCKKCGHEWQSKVHNRTINNHGCPACNSSKGEKAIENYFKDNNVNFVMQYKFSECRNIAPLPFDFAIMKDGKPIACIEYDGIQHFEPKTFGSKTETGGEMLKTIKKNDTIKSNFCRLNNIYLLRIPYTRFDNVEPILERFLNKIKREVKTIVEYNRMAS